MYSIFWSLLLFFLVFFVGPILYFYCSTAQVYKPPVLPKADQRNAVTGGYKTVDKLLNKFDFTKTPKLPPSSNFFGRYEGQEIDKIGDIEVQYLSYSDQIAYYKQKGINSIQMYDLIDKNREAVANRDLYTAKRYDID